MRSRWQSPATAGAARRAAVLGAALAAVLATADGRQASARPPAEARAGAGAESDRGADKKTAGAAGGLVVSLGQGARVDWTRGLLVATGAAAGDLRAPSPELARVKAERQARDAARARLKRLARDLALADGRELGAALQGDAAERLERALDQLVDQSVEHASDGSVVLEAALPLEAARAAVFGPSEPAVPGSEKGPTSVVIDAGKHLKRPALGVKLAAGSERYAGPTVFAMPGDPIAAERLGSRPVRLHATGYRGGALQLGGDAAAQLAEARGSGALVVVEMTPGRGRDDKKDADKEKRR